MELINQYNKGIKEVRACHSRNDQNLKEEKRIKAEERSKKRER